MPAIELNSREHYPVYFSLMSRFTRVLGLASVCLISSCALWEQEEVKHHPQGNYVWHRIQPTTPAEPGQAYSVSDLRAAKESCTLEAQAKPVPPEACKPDPGRTCTGFDYAFGVCLPDKPTDLICNNDQINGAFEARDKYFELCMKKSGWAATWVPVH